MEFQFIHTQTNRIKPEFGEATIGWTVDGRAGWRAQEFADRYYTLEIWWQGTSTLLAGMTMYQ